jgi:hypothetical protein
MSNAYALATCILIARRRTPVIEELFGSIACKFEEASSTDAPPAPDGYQVFTFYLEDGDGFSDSDPVFESLQNLHRTLGISTHPNELSAVEALRGLCSHFNQPDHPVIETLLDEDQDGHVTIETIGKLAEVLNDGHDLWSLSVQQGYWADRPVNGNFGGSAQYLGSHFAGAFGTNSSLDAAKDLQTKLSQGNISAAAKAVSARVRGVLAAIRRNDQRSAVHAELHRILGDTAAVGQCDDARHGSVPRRLTSVVLSTIHVPKEDSARVYLEEKGDSTEFGWLWRVPPRRADLRDLLDVPPWLQPILAYADAEGIDRIEFDGDGEEVQALPIYEHC